MDFYEFWEQHCQEQYGFTPESVDEINEIKEVAQKAWNAALENQWMDIESAPKDGTEILVVFRGRVRIAHWDPVFGSDGWFVGNLRTLLSDRLECWMPIPAPPKEK